MTHEKLNKQLTEIGKKYGVDVVFKFLPSNGGFYYPSLNKIEISDFQTYKNKKIIFFHELGHKLDNINGRFSKYYLSKVPKSSLRKLLTYYKKYAVAAEHSASMTGEIESKKWFRGLKIPKMYTTKKSKQNLINFYFKQFEKDLK